MKPPAPVTSTVICGAPCVWPVPWHDCCAFSRSSGMYARCRVPGRNQDREESQDVVTNKTEPRQVLKSVGWGNVCAAARPKKEGLRSPWSGETWPQCLLPYSPVRPSTAASWRNPDGPEGRYKLVQSPCNPHLADRRQAHVHVACVAPRCLLADCAQRVILDGPLEVLHVHGVALEPPPERGRTPDACMSAFQSKYRAGLSCDFSLTSVVPGSVKRVCMLETQHPGCSIRTAAMPCQKV